MPSTAAPAFTIMNTLRGFARDATNSCIECAPMMLRPLALPFTKASTFSTVRLNTATVNPFDSMFMMRFSPMTASPMRPMSACFISIILFRLNSLLKCLVFYHKTGPSKRHSPDTRLHPFPLNPLCAIPCRETHSAMPHPEEIRNPRAGAREHPRERNGGKQ